MHGYARSFVVAAMLVATSFIAVACGDSGTEPPPGGNGQDPTLAHTVALTQPRSGTRVNETDSPDTPVRLVAEVSVSDAALYHASGIECVWYASPVGEQISPFDITPVSTAGVCEAVNVFGVDTWRVEVIARLAEKHTVSASDANIFEIRHDSVVSRLFISAPPEGLVVEVGEMIPCAYSTLNPRGYSEQVTWRILGSGQFNCSTEEGLLVPAGGMNGAPSGAPASQALTLGEHIVEVCATFVGADLDGPLCQQREVQVVPVPPQVVFGNSAAGDFYTIKLVDGEAQAERLTFDGAPKNFPDISPDGTRLVYTSSERGDEDHETCFIYVRNLATGSTVEHAYEQANDCRAVKWSPDGSRIAFTGGYEDPDFGADYQTVFTINADGSGFHVVAPRTCNADFTNKPCTGGTASRAVWHPEGLIFSQTEHVQSEARSYVALVNPATGEDIHRLHEDPINVQRGLNVYSISPDNRLVTMESTKNQIHVLRTDGSGEVGVFMAQTQALFCGSSDWVYYTAIEDNHLIFRRVRPNGDRDEVFTITDAPRIVIPRCIPQN